MLRAYNLIHANDTHPVFASFDFNGWELGWAPQFYPVVDVIGIHNYPYYSNTGNLSDGSMYGLWQDGLSVAAANNKGFIPTGQGFGAGWSPWRNPSYEELRFQAYSAIVQGSQNFLWWMDNAADSTVKGYVARLMSEMQIADVRAGVTKQVGNIVYRTSGNIILAVNIGASVAANIPATGTSADVLNESRNISIVNGVIADSFTKYQVHIYILK